MAYNSAKYQLTHLLQDAWFRMGQLRHWLVTGGSETTVVNSAWAGVEDVIYEDDDPALIYGTAVVVKTGDGTAPEGKMSRITDYDSSTYTITNDTFGEAVESGDTVAIASPLFPLQDMMQAANIAVKRIGEIDVPDTSITVVSNQTEYTLPATIQRRPLLVEISDTQTPGNYMWEKLAEWSVVPATAGSTWTLIVPTLPVGQTLRVWYRGMHPRLSAYDSDIIETVHPELMLCALLVEAYQWYNNQIGGTNQYMVQRENKALQDLEAAMVKYPISHLPEQVKGLPHWTNRRDYVPGTSDLRA